MQEYHNHDERTLHLPPESPLVNAMYQNRAALLLAVEPMVRPLVRYLSARLRAVLTRQEIAAVVEAFGEDSEEVGCMYDAVEKSLVYRWKFRSMMDQHKLELLVAQVADKPAFGAAIKSHITDLVTDLINEHRTWTDFEASKEYRELWENSPVFRQEMRENW